MEVFTVGVDASYLDPSQTTTSTVELFGLSYAHCPPVQSSAVLLSTQINMHRVSMLGNLYEGIIVMACSLPSVRNHVSRLLTSNELVRHGDL